VKIEEWVYALYGLTPEGIKIVEGKQIEVRANWPSVR
jgi:hypothetical protein